MKIVHIIASYKPAYIYGGPIQSVGKLCEALKDNVLLQAEDNISHVEVLTTTANGKKELDVETGKQQTIDGVPVTYFKRWTKDHSHFSPGLLWALRKEISKSLKLKSETPKPNKQISKLNKRQFTIKNEQQLENTELIIHIHAWWNLVSVLSCWIAKWYNIPVILSSRGMLTSYTQGNRNSIAKKLIHTIIGKRLLKYCHIHVTSEQEEEDVLKIVQAKCITVIPNLVSFPQEISNIDYLVSRQNLKLIFLSRIEEKKGLDLLFRALALLNFPWSLTIAGTGDESYIKSLKERTERLKIYDRINWVGQVSNEDKYDLLASHDLLVLTSYNENFANVVIESLSVGTPVLLSDKVGLADYVEERDLGWTCKLKPEHIHTQIMNIYYDQITREMIRIKAPGIIRSDFKDEVLIKKYIALYKKGCSALLKMTT